MLFIYNFVSLCGDQEAWRDSRPSDKRAGSPGQ